MFHPPAPLVSELEKRLKDAPQISLFLDFDGTLAPITADPDTTALEPRMTATLNRLSHQQPLVTTVISGRAIEDLYSRIRLSSLIYAGNHGLEIFGRGLRFVEPSASARRVPLERLCEELVARLRPVPGVNVEFKGLTASIHYRRAAEADLGLVQQTVYAATAQHGDLFRIVPGRKVFDIVPRTNWHKGAAVQWINNELGEPAPVTIYLGDDTTDEDAFSVLPDAITIKVGNAPVTCARYQLPGPAAVHEFLEWLSIRLQN